MTVVEKNGKPSLESLGRLHYFRGKHFPEQSLPEGGYQERKDFLFCRFLHDASFHFASRYLEHITLHPFRQKFLKDAEEALLSAVDGFLNLPETSGDVSFLFRQSAERFLELENDYGIFLKMKRLRTFDPYSEILLRFRKFHCRDLQTFRDWVGMERYDSDLLAESVPEKENGKGVGDLYPSSSELAANAMILDAKLCAGILLRMSRH